ncbi:MAG: SH3 domain-containing protein [Rubrivivax sp.]|nr:MAG: SH3 domain-containing protein [Rubrivivax sp.]
MPAAAGRAPRAVRRRQLPAGAEGGMKAALLALAVLSATAAQAQTGPQFVHGSWVNVREAAAATARAVEQLTTNTPVDVTARQGEWCAVRFGAGRSGFVACNLLGAKPLTLAEAGSNAARAFWVAPSPNRLAAYGLSLTPPPALKLEALKKTLKYGDTVRFPPVPEFEAAKKLLKAGVKLDPLLEVTARPKADLVAALQGYRLRPAAIKPSLFRTHDSVALVSEQDADGLAAVAGSRVRLAPAGLPTAWHSRHDGPEIEGLTGFWDVGHAVLSFEPAITLYSVAANGLVGAAAARGLPFDVGGEGHYCGAHYLGKSLPENLSVTQAHTSDEGADITQQRGHPVLKEGSEVLVTLAVPRDRPLRQSAQVRTQSQAVKGLKISDGQTDPEVPPTVAPRAVLREIDLDGDGVADVLQIETPRFVGTVTPEVIYRRTWFVNINGQWFAAGEWEDQDCT